MHGRLAEMGWERLAPSAMGGGIVAVLLFSLAHVDAAAADARAVILGALGLMMAVMASMGEEAAPPEEASWYEYDGAFRGI